MAEPTPPLRRRPSSNPNFFLPNRRSSRIYAIAVAISILLFLVARYSDNLDASSEDGEAGSYRRIKRKGSMLPFLGKDEHVVDKFVKSFPQLRGEKEMGRPKGKEDRTAFDWPRISRMFVFGDSYSTIDVNYRENGVDGGHHERLHNRAIDMKWADYLYAVFHDFHVTKYYNFARPGAVIDDIVVPPGLKEYGSFQTQVEEFRDLFTPLPGPPRVDWHANDSLFISFFGINDMGRMNREDIGQLDIPTTSAALAKSLVDSCREIEALGARNFLIVNLPPLEHSPKYNLLNEPGIRSHDLIAESTKAFNRYLAEEIDKWRAEPTASYPRDGVNRTGDGNDQSPATIDKTVLLFDLQSFWNIVLQYPEMFGMTDCSRFKMSAPDWSFQPGRMGLCYHDNQHISWSSAELIARTVNGYMNRHSRSFQMANLTESTIYP